MSRNRNFVLRVSDEDRERFRRAAFLRGFRQRLRPDEGDISSWLRELAYTDCSEVEDAVTAGVLPDYVPPVKAAVAAEVTPTSPPVRGGPARIAPPCAHVPKGSYCDRCGTVRRSW